MPSDSCHWAPDTLFLLPACVKHSKYNNVSTLFTIIVFLISIGINIYKLCSSRLKIFQFIFDFVQPTFYNVLLRMLAEGKFVDKFSDCEVDRIWCLLNTEVGKRSSDTVHNFLTRLEDVSSNCESEKAGTVLLGNFLLWYYLFVCWRRLLSTQPFKQ